MLTNAALLPLLAVQVGGARIATAGTGCGALPRGTLPPDASVVLVVNDAMRRDRMGVYGGEADTPFFDRLAREHFWFTRAVSQAPWTKPSIATLFTSLYPSLHGVHTHPRGQTRAGEKLSRRVRSTDRLPSSADTLAEAFRASGFRTAAFVANPWMDRRFGFAQGFERYDDSPAQWYASGDTVVERALAWLASMGPQERFFLYVHTIDSHRPYPALSWEEVEGSTARPPIRGMLSSPLRDEIAGLLRLEGPRPPGARPPPELRVLQRAYDKGIEEFDRNLGRLLHGLERTPRPGRIVVVVTSDHGEALYERGYGGHSMGLYQSELAIPLVMLLPGAGRGRLDCRVGLIDLMPTLCDGFDLTCPSSMAGRSLFAGGRGERASSTYRGEASARDPRDRAVYRDDYKLIHQPGWRPGTRRKLGPWQLFDLRDDPQERRDLLRGSRLPPEINRIFVELRETLREASSPSRLTRDAGPAVIDGQLERRLRALGYLD